MKPEIAELVEKINAYELAQKTNKNLVLNEEEKQVVAELDQWAREIGKTGNDKNHEIAAFVLRQIEEQLNEDLDPVIEQIFEVGSIGEFDSYEAYASPKNTLQAIEAAKGGNVDRSFIDFRVLKPKWINRQV